MNETVFLISGAAGGLGSALSLAAARAGAQLMLLDSNSPGLDRVSDAISEEGLSRPGICPLDLAAAEPDSFQQLARIMGKEFHGLNHLVHCAAHFNGLTPLDQISPQEWITTIQVNLNAAWALTTACMPMLREASQASITFVGDHPSRSESAFWGPYAVSKAALRSLTAIFQQELESTQIHVREFDPGSMRTGLRAKAYLAEDPTSQPEPASAAAALLESIIGARELPRSS